MTMWILFLDIDGVMLLHRQKRFDPEAVKNLSRIVRYTGCKIVVSSAWRFRYTLSQLQNTFTTNGCEESTRPFSVTNPCIQSRSQAILRYLEEHSDVEGYVVVDDYQVMGVENLIRTDPRRGLGRLDSIEVLRSFLDQGCISQQTFDERSGMFRR